jgi:hypothetical protein
MKRIAIRSLRKAAFELPPEPFDHRQLYELSRSTTASDIQSIYQLGEKTKEQVLLREQGTPCFVKLKHYSWLTPLI